MEAIPSTDLVPFAFIKLSLGAIVAMAYALVVFMILVTQREKAAPQLEPPHRNIRTLDYLRRALILPTSWAVISPMVLTLPALVGHNRNGPSMSPY